MAEETCNTCGQIKKKLNFIQKMAWFEYRMKKKMIKKLIKKYELCEECHQRIKKQ